MERLCKRSGRPSSNVILEYMSTKAGECVQNATELLTDASNPLRELWPLTITIPARTNAAFPCNDDSDLIFETFGAVDKPKE